MVHDEDQAEIDISLFLINLKDKLKISLLRVISYIIKNPTRSLFSGLISALIFSYIFSIQGDLALANSIAAFSIIFFILIILVILFFNKKLGTETELRISSNSDFLYVLPFQILMLFAIVSIMMNDLSRATSFTIYALGTLLLPFISIFIRVIKKQWKI
tara:strand:- start:129 stop:605 length:477 start_codon:yes stop_codon:yes gene_type:complete